MRVVSPETNLLDRFDVVVDPDAEPIDLGRFLDVLDQIVERRFSQRNPRTSGGTPAMAVVNITTGE